MSTTMGSEIMNMRELSRRLGVHPNTLAAMRRRGDLPAPVIGGLRPRWSRVVVEQWLAGQRPQKG